MGAKRRVVRSEYKPSENSSMNGCDDAVSEIWEGLPYVYKAPWTSRGHVHDSNPCTLQKNRRRKTKSRAATAKCLIIARTYTPAALTANVRPMSWEPDLSCNGGRRRLFSVVGASNRAGRDRFSRRRPAHPLATKQY